MKFIKRGGPDASDRFENFSQFVGANGRNQRYTGAIRYSSTGTLQYPMKFSILTASFHQLGWLKRCIRSVADQQGVAVEHLIQDAGTGLDLEHWVRWNTEARLMVVPDRGIYDWLNYALRRVTGDVFGILNCDEQYLPGTLARVQAEFEAHPEADLVVGDFLLVDPRLNLLAFRRATPLRPSMILTDHLYDFTCAMFFRSRLLERGVRFNPDYKAAGDADFVARLLRTGVRVRYVRQYLAAFTILDSNLSLRADRTEELRRLRAITPGWALAAAPLLRQIRHLEKLLAGGYSSGPIEYALYAGDDAEARTQFRCERPGFRHPWAGKQRKQGGSL